MLVVDAAPVHKPGHKPIFKVQQQHGSEVHPLLGLSLRDQRILALTRAKLGADHHRFDDALLALREAAEELIPAGRTSVLGSTAQGPVVGSIISGVGWNRQWCTLGRLTP